VRRERHGRDRHQGPLARRKRHPRARHRGARASRERHRRNGIESH